MTNRSLMLAVSLFLLALGCARFPQTNVIGFTAARVPQSRIVKLKAEMHSDQNIFSETTDTAILATNAPQDLRLSRSLLGTVFVWGAWIEKSDGSIYPFEFGTGLSLQSTLVSFRLSPDGKWVHLFEVESGRTDSAAESSLIDRFPVSRADDDAVEFDYSKGLQTKILKTWISPESLKIEASYSFVYGLDNSEGKITFAQLLKLQDVTLSTMILRHSFRPLADDDGFAPVLLPSPWKFGFMPSRSISADEARTATNIPVRRYDYAKPIKWYVSSSVPLRFRDSIRKGLLSWNDAFGRGVLEVEQLSAPVAWASSRLNIFQWTDDPAACGGAAAFGPSEANPLTGKIYSGKVLFCGSRFFDIYDKAVDPRRYGRDEFESELIRWAASHEVGHALGFGHNFYAKYYRDPSDVNVISSSVMDYPNPEDVMRIASVGPRDRAMVQFLYLTQGSLDAWQEVEKFPICDDDAVETIPACTQFVRGMDPHSLVDWYLRALADGSANQNDAKIVSVPMKQILTTEDGGMVEKFSNILAAHVQSPVKLGTLFVRYMKANRATFSALKPNHRASVYQLLEDFVFDPECTAMSDVGISIVEEIAHNKDMISFAALENIRTRIASELPTNSDLARQSELRRFNARVDQLLGGFWLP